MVSLQYHVVADPAANTSRVSTGPLDGTHLGQCRDHGRLVLGQVRSAYAIELEVPRLMVDSPIVAGLCGSWESADNLPGEGKPTEISQHDSAD